MPGETKALIVDVDGVVSPVHGRTAWGDDVVAGNLFGPVIVSPTMCQRLDQLDRAPGAACWWLTSWTTQMRSRMNPFPGRTWPVIAELTDAAATGRTWWKLLAIEKWLDGHPDIRALAWCDDDLRGGRHVAARRRFTPRGVEALLLVPKVDIGLTPAHLVQLEAWASQ